MTGTRILNTRNPDRAPQLPLTGDYVFCLDDLELAFPKEQLKAITRMWNQGSEIDDIAEEEGRYPHEVFLALFHQARKGIITRPFAFRMD